MFSFLWRFIIATIIATGISIFLFNIYLGVLIWFIVFFGMKIKSK